MVLLIFKVVFLIVGAGAGYYLVNIFLTDYLKGNFLLIGQFVGIIFFAFLGYLFGTLIGRRIIKDVTEIDKRVKDIPGNNLIIGLLGLTTGIVLALLVSIALRSIPFVGIFIPIFLVLVFSYAGIILALRNKELLVTIFKLNKKEKSEKGYIDIQGKAKSIDRVNAKPKLLDTSSIIDGRIADIIIAGFIEGEIIIPGFIVNELQGIADSSDNLKRLKGRSGLDILQRLRDNKKLNIKFLEKDFAENNSVDSKLILLAKELEAIIVTSDYNLNKVANLKGIAVLNINDLQNALKLVVLPGEKMKVEVIKEGKEKEQGVAYLEDGTMIVIEGGKRLVGKEIDILITGILQTPAGRMIFSKAANGE
ncbi:MAG: hypothetical protein PHU65_00655 [Actinomycetota bacterium]|jgi:uncharacterized protein YacL|nr:hypothetical protein [Actinomycetota bacterium]